METGVIKVLDEKRSIEIKRIEREQNIYRSIVQKIRRFFFLQPVPIAWDVSPEMLFWSLAHTGQVPFYHNIIVNMQLLIRLGYEVRVEEQPKRKLHEYTVVMKCYYQGKQLSYQVVLCLRLEISQIVLTSVCYKYPCKSNNSFPHFCIDFLKNTCHNSLFVQAYDR